MVDSLKDEVGLSAFSRSEDKTLRVQVLLDADEFVRSRDLAKSLGISQSALFRVLLKDELKRIAHEELSMQSHLADTSTPTQNLHTVNEERVAEIIVRKLLGRGGL